MRPKVETDRAMSLVLSVLNDVFLLEKRIGQIAEAKKLYRYTERIREHFAQFGYTIENPMGEKYSETRTDCDASIAGVSTENLVIRDVLKPVVRLRTGDTSVLVQRAVVIVSGE